MRTLIIVVSLALAVSACAPGYGSGHRPLALRANPSDVIATELAFAREARDKGTWTAFRDYATRDAQWPGPRFESVQAALKGVPDPAQAIVWEPDQVWASCDGTFALSSGPATHPNGKRTRFATICAACHQPGGEGLAGLAPQLLYSKYVLGNERQLARIVLNGKEKEGLAMPPLRALDDETIAGALTYVRQSWGHNAPPVSPATIAAVRKAVGDREAPWSEEELQTVP